MPRPLIIANANARRVRDDRALLPALAQLAQRHARLEVTRSLGELHRLCARFVDEHTGADGGWAPLVLVGGDGTHMAGVSALVEASGSASLRIPVALASGGTVCTTARLWGSTGSAVRDVERALLPRALIARPSLRVHDDHGQKHTGFIWGTGLVARFFTAYDKTDGGALSAASLALRITASAFRDGPLARSILSPMPLRICVDGEPLDGDAFSLAVCAVHESVGLGIKVTYRAHEDPARIHLVASRGTVPQLARAAHRTLLGARLGEHTHDLLAKHIEVELLEQPHGAYVMDGDTFYASRLTLSPGPLLHIVSLRT